MYEEDFQRWLKRVEDGLVTRFGMPKDDLPDYCWRVLHSEGCSVMQALNNFADDMGYNKVNTLYEGKM